MSGDVPQSLGVIARRYTRDAAEADDLVQAALLAAVEAGRADFASGQARAWLAGVIRNKARMSARGAVRRKARERDWQSARAGEESEAIEIEGMPDVSGLPRSLRLVAMLAFAGATRPEIGWLLGLSDTALRQRISRLKRAIKGLPPGKASTALEGALPFGALRRSMIDQLGRRGGFLASHDPDGHLFVLASSQKPGARQPMAEQSEKEII
ncbi:sigma-70 family RNA polymerase sigma factor [Henriciella sp. AS95]|uniref:RNA polymerase sigma factor n=1 Tax=Henriciella sp. AS95 TaxID=3135782 RepID=UPI0031750F01